MDKNIVIEAKNFNFYYGDVKALTDVNIKIEKNSVTGIIGPSGCGKSTFLRSLNLMNNLILSARYEGQIIIDGEDILHKDMDVVELRRKVGMVFQKSNPFPKSIFENLPLRWIQQRL